jgi:hypothetical protein
MDTNRDDCIELRIVPLWYDHHLRAADVSKVVLTRHHIDGIRLPGPQKTSHPTVRSKATYSLLGLQLLETKVGRALHNYC